MLLVKNCIRKRFFPYLFNLSGGQKNVLNVIGSLLNISSVEIDVSITYTKKGHFEDYILANIGQ